MIRNLHRFVVSNSPLDAQRMVEGALVEIVEAGNVDNMAASMVGSAFQELQAEVMVQATLCDMMD